MRNYYSILTAVCLLSTATLAQATESSPLAGHSRSSISRVAASGDDERQPSNGSSDRERYRAREASSAKAKDFKGGDTVVIGASALALALAVIVILVLL
jgi:hypothetical protein